MKNQLFVSFFAVLFCISFAHAQANPEDAAIKTSLTGFINSIKDKKIEQGVNYIYPKFFTVIPKEQMTRILAMTYNNPFMKIEISSLKFGAIEKPEKIGSEYFAMVPYFFTLKCNVSSMNDEMKRKIDAAFTQKYGKNNVKYLATEGAYLINAGMRACAVSRDRKNWKFVILEKEYKPQLVKVLPKKALDKI
ncbi:hypothetical protein [Chryseobacterium hagamense]|nr:hypothetical protein [Chryseobacterium hagamense]